MKCKKCNSTRLVGWGSKTVKGGKTVQRYQCKNCGHVGEAKK